MVGRFVNRMFKFSRGLVINTTPYMEFTKFHTSTISKLDTKSGKKPTNSSITFPCSKPFRITVGGDMYTSETGYKSKFGRTNEKPVSKKTSKLGPNELHTSAECKVPSKDLFSSDYQPEVKFSGEYTSDNSATHCITSTSYLTTTLHVNKPLVPIQPATSNDSAICTDPSDPHFHWLP
jgi:hypothetical protein